MAEYEKKMFLIKVPPKIEAKKASSVILQKYVVSATYWSGAKVLLQHYDTPNLALSNVVVIPGLLTGSIIFQLTCL